MLDPETTAKPKKTAKPRKSGRDLLLAAARQEFARRGFEGARIDEIASKAGVNKQLVYHHFGAKEALYREVLTAVYVDIRAKERALDLTQKAPDEAMRALIAFSFDYLHQNPEFVSLLADENFHEGRHLREADHLAGLHGALIEGIAHTLDAGRAAGLFRTGVDPRQLYISIAGLGFFYFSNVHTLSAIFGEPLGKPPAVAARRAHVIDFVMNSLRADPES
ncbi:TetR/AcrR family transcriptional regulator [Acuticoccus sp. MNP-M23]|uniref:TetR/AcrR family transcriptional regulator n=1 Tax=Acuticoccus sp. MNP-M23 TaxID=3072793 RepID=UPI00281536A4|nr:TetR/AcrR family transcriptional regulator [Acuticoccus sp. MNP-M23]WMS44130.1 TetR/AcrR family transcriptional regulator [Acuticoccus sp. MNP-M23]